MMDAADQSKKPPQVCLSACRVSALLRRGGAVPVRKNEPRSLQHGSPTASNCNSSMQIASVPLSRVFRPRRRRHRAHHIHTTRALSLGTLNVQGLSWTQTSSRMQLAHLVKVCREKRFHALVLTDLTTPDWLANKEGVTLLALEEYTVLIRGQIGIMVAPPVLRAWRQGSAQRSVPDKEEGGLPWSSAGMAQWCIW